MWKQGGKNLKGIQMTKIRAEINYRANENIVSEI